MGEETKSRKREGKLKDQVRLNILISDDIDAELARLCAVMGWDKSKAVREALIMWENSLRLRGI
jgi:hypothetical protein